MTDLDLIAAFSRHICAIEDVPDRWPHSPEDFEVFAWLDHVSNR